MIQDGYRDLRVPDDGGRPAREEVARLICLCDAITDGRRTARTTSRVAGNVLEALTRRGLLRTAATDRVAGRGRPAPPAELPRPAPS